MSSPVQSSPVNCCWFLQAQSFLVSGPIVARDLIFVLPRVLSVLKWSLLFKIKVNRQSVYLGVKPHLRSKTRFLFLSENCGFVDVGRTLWQGTSLPFTSLLAVALKSKSQYNRRSVLVSSPMWGPKQDFYYCKLRFCWWGVPSLMRGHNCHLLRTRSVVHVIYIYSFTCSHSTCP
jgi:hypothetical protein